MTRFLKISSLILGLFVICAPNCTDEQGNANREDALLEQSKSDIRTEFETDYLTEASLFAFEATAKQRLTDFADYFNIVADTSLEMQFRTKAGELIKSCFVSENVILRLTEKNEQNKDLDVGLLIRLSLENKLLLPLFSIDSIIVFEPLHRTGKSIYTGKLAFVQNFPDAVQPDRKEKRLPRITEMRIQKEIKLFGTDTLRIWNVRLGEIW